MNLSQRGDSGAGAGLGTGSASPAHPGYQVGLVGFGPSWSAEDSMAASIIRLEQENDELRAEVALLREEQSILRQERDNNKADAIVEELDNDYLRGRLAEWRECAEKLAGSLKFIAEWGGKIHQTEMGDISCDGGWCAEQAQWATAEFERLKEASK
jgi:predicted RNase H-like nuclease (RuvC/YqgF family)